MHKECENTMAARGQFDDLVRTVAETFDEPMVISPSICVGIIHYRPDFLLPLLRITFRFADHLPPEGKKACGAAATKVCDIMKWDEVVWDHGMLTVEDVLAHWSPDLIAVLQTMSEVKIMFSGLLSEQDLNEVRARFGTITYSTPAQDVTVPAPSTRH